MKFRGMTSLSEGGDDCPTFNFGMNRRDFFGCFTLGLGGAALATAGLKVRANLG